MHFIFNEMFQIKYPHKITLFASFLKDIISEIFVSFGWFLDSFLCTYTSALQNSIRKTRKVKFVEVPASAVSQYFGVDLISSVPHILAVLKGLYMELLVLNRFSNLCIGKN